MIKVINLVIMLAVILAILAIAISGSNGDWGTAFLALPALVIAALMLRKRKPKSPNNLNGK